jgi:membrane-bound serine protease (ClpP class)
MFELEGCEVERSVYFAVGTAVFRLKTLANLSPDNALILLTLGLLLIYVELNRPGWIITGALGLLASLFAIASLLRLELNPAAIALICTAVALLGLDLLRRTQPMVVVAATLALVLGFSHLVLGAPEALRIHTVTAVVCGVVIGVGTSILTRIARRARTNKGLD